MLQNFLRPCNQFEATLCQTQKTDPDLQSSLRWSSIHQSSILAPWQQQIGDHGFHVLHANSLLLLPPANAVARTKVSRELRVSGALGYRIHNHKAKARQAKPVAAGRAAS